MIPRGEISGFPGRRHSQIVVEVPSSADDLGEWDAAILSRLPWLCDATVTLSTDDDICCRCADVVARKKGWGEG
jgi:hypothetical protein